MNSKQEQAKVVFWEYISTDTNGDITIKIKSKEAQQELQALVQAGDAKLAKELEAKKKKLEAVTLKDIEAFDNAIAELISTDAVFIKAGKMTGRNLQIDWNKADKSNSTGSKQQGTKQKKQLEVIHVDAQFDF